MVPCQGSDGCEIFSSSIREGFAVDCLFNFYFSDLTKGVLLQHCPGCPALLPVCVQPCHSGPPEHRGSPMAAARVQCDAGRLQLLPCVRRQERSFLRSRTCEETFFQSWPSLASRINTASQPQMATFTSISSLVGRASANRSAIILDLVMMESRSVEVYSQVALSPVFGSQMTNLQLCCGQ